MTPEQAVAAAQAASPRLGVPASYRPLSAERRIIEIVADAPLRDELPQPGPVMDRVAWVVRLGEGIAWAELAVDEADGNILRLRRSRGAAAAWEREAHDHG